METHATTKKSLMGRLKKLVHKENPSDANMVGKAIEIAKKEFEDGKKVVYVAQENEPSTQSPITDADVEASIKAVKESFDHQKPRVSGGSKMKWFVKLNQKLDWQQRNKKTLWLELLFYATWISVIVCAYKSLLPEFWLCVLFFSVLGFWILLSSIRVAWVLYLRHYIFNEKLGG